MSLARAGTSLLGLAATSAASVHLAFGLRVGANVLEGSSVAEIAVDTGQFASLGGCDTLNVDVTLALGRALLFGQSNIPKDSSNMFRALTFPQDLYSLP